MVAGNKDALLLYTAAQSANLCGRCERTWRTWDAAGRVPRPVRIGRSVFWRPEEIAQWIEAGCPDRKTWDGRDE